MTNNFYALLIGIDRATKELMIAFYEYYLELGNKAIALQKAINGEYNLPLRLTPSDKPS